MGISGLHFLAIYLTCQLFGVGGEETLSMIGCLALSIQWEKFVCSYCNKRSGLLFLVFYPTCQIVIVGD
jgi:hypothetical protein